MDSRESANEGTPCLPRSRLQQTTPAILDRPLTYPEHLVKYQISRIVWLAAKRCQVRAPAYTWLRESVLEERPPIAVGGNGPSPVTAALSGGLRPKDRESG